MLRMISFIHLVRITDFLSWFQIYKIIITDASYLSLILQKIQKLGYRQFLTFIVSLCSSGIDFASKKGGFEPCQLNPQTSQSIVCFLSAIYFNLDCLRARLEY